MKKDLKNVLEEILKMFSTNLTFLRVLRSYCTDEAPNNAEFKDVIIAIEDMITRQEKGVNILQNAVISQND